MRTMNTWLLAGLIGVSLAGGANAAPMIIDDFNNNVTVTPTDGGSTGPYWGYGNPLDNGLPHTDPLTSPSITDAIREFTREYPGSPNEGDGYVSGGKATFLATHTSAAPGAQIQMQMEYYLPTPISLAVGESLVLKGTGSYSDGGASLDPVWQSMNDGLTYGYGIVTSAGWNPATGENANGGGGLQIGLNDSGGTLTDLTFSYDDLVNAGYAVENINHIFLYFYAYNTSSMNEYWEPITTYNTSVTFVADKFGIGPLDNDPPLGVPEPETVWMIVAVLASLGVTFRRQLMDLAGRFVKT